MQLKCSVPLEVYAGIALDGLGHRSFSADLHVYALPRYAHQATHRWIESSPMGSCPAAPLSLQHVSDVAVIPDLFQYFCASFGPCIPA